LFWPGGLSRPGGKAGTGFAAGGAADGMAPGAVLAGLTAAASGQAGKVSDDELIGIARAWRRLSSWVAAGELAAVAELVARRHAQVAAGADPHIAEHVGDEFAAALTLTSRSADLLVGFAAGLGQLPATRAALAAGQIDRSRAWVIVNETTALDSRHAAAVEAAVIGRAGGQTTGQLRAATRRAVLAADPAAADRRREEARKDARVETWSEHSGTAALAGRDLPPADMLIPGYGGGDKHIIAVEGGETVVPKHLTPAVAPLMKAHNVPGFAAGGLIPNYSGGFAGMAPLAPNFNKAFIGQFTTAMETSMTAQMKTAIAAAKAAAAAASGGLGVAATGPLQTYARKLLAAHGWASQWPAFADIVARESGWNVHATNPTSGAYGIPQALPPGKMASAGADWRTSGYTQLRWMMGYIGSRWGDPINADRNEVSQHWYDRGGWVPPGVLLAVNSTGRPERVVPPGGFGSPESSARLEAKLDRVCTLLAASPQATGDALARGLQQTAHRSAQAGMYSTRRG
jgi:hypothetical protein